jgi:cystine transport system permease protein
LDSFDLIVESLPLLFKGALMTLKLLFLSVLLSFSLGLFFGVLTSQRLKVPVISPLIEMITFILRGVPFFVQLLIVYYVLPDLVGVQITLLPASVFALGVCSSGYVAQIVRGSLNAIPPAQWEAAFVLGLTPFLTLRHVILPQTIRLALPSLNNEVDSLLKSTSIVSSIGMLELTRMGMNIVSRELEPIPIYLTVAAIYLSMSAALNLFSRKLERSLLC